MDRLLGQASPEALRSERDGEREKPVKPVLESTSWALWTRGAGSLSVDGTYLAGTVGQGCRLFKPCQNLLPGSGGQVSSVRTYLQGNAVQGCRLFKSCWNGPPRHCGAGVQVV